MEKNKVRLIIGGMEFRLTTTDDVEYLKKLGDEVDERLSAVRKENPKLSVSRAGIICALQIADEMHKSEERSSTLRKEIQAYMEDASKAKTDAEVSRREADRLNKEIAELKNELSRYRRDVY
ncbi:MAG: cell division protein ZapA [Clostridia bacterium]|nr:cell division protein ZapA [Clostridia bacterium]